MRGKNGHFWRFYSKFQNFLQQFANKNNWGIDHSIVPTDRWNSLLRATASRRNARRHYCPTHTEVKGNSLTSSSPVQLRRNAPLNKQCSACQQLTAPCGCIYDVTKEPLSAPTELILLPNPTLSQFNLNHLSNSAGKGVS